MMSSHFVLRIGVGLILRRFLATLRRGMWVIGAVSSALFLGVAA
jgi:hypothetical protein